MVDTADIFVARFAVEYDRVTISDVPVPIFAPNLTVRRPLACAVAVCSAFALVCLTTLESGFVTADDPIQMLLAAGQPTGRTLYSNSLAMGLVAFLGDHVPGPNWYTLQLVAVHLLASIAVAYALFRAARPRWAWPLLGLVLVSFEARFLVDLQFTHTATAATVAGLVLLLVAGARRDQDCRAGVRLGSARAKGQLQGGVDDVRDDDSADGGGRWWMVAAAGVGLATWGSLLRLEGFLLGVAVLGPLLLAVALARRDRRLAAALTLMAVLVVGGAAADRWVYVADPAWSDFREFRPAMLRLLNGQRVTDLPGRTDADVRLQAALDEVGWTAAEWALFADYRFEADPETFSATAVGRLADRLVVARRPGEALTLLLAQKSSFAYLPAIALIAWLPLLDRFRRGYAAAVVFVALAATSVVSYLLALERLPRHVRLPLVYALAVPAVIAAVRMAPEWRRASPALPALAVALAMSLGLGAVILQRDVTENRIDRGVHERIVATLLPDDDALYLLVNFEYLRTLPPWIRLDTLRHRLLPVAEFARTPLVEPGLRQVGASSMIDAVARGRVRVIATPRFVELLATHLRQRYGLEVEAQVLGVVGEPPADGERDRRNVAARFVPAAEAER